MDNSIEITKDMKNGYGKRKKQAKFEGDKDVKLF